MSTKLYRCHDIRIVRNYGTLILHVIQCNDQLKLTRSQLNRLNAFLDPDDKSRSAIGEDFELFQISHDGNIYRTVV